MLKFHPPGFGQKIISTRLGQVAYYTAVETFWQTPTAKQPSSHQEKALLERTLANPERPVVVFFHTFGGGASAFEWSKVYPVLASTYAVAAPDLIGWGASSHPVRRYTTQDYLENIEDFLKQISPRPVVAVASSFSAALVVRIAARQPELFERLFLSCPAGFRDFGTDAGRRIPAPIINTPWLDKVIYALGATHEVAVRNFLENFLFAQRDRLCPETVSAYLASAQQPNADYAALAFLRGDLYFDLAPYLVQLQVPTAMVWGEKALFTPLEIGRRLAGLNPEAVQRFQVVSNTGVLPHLEQPGVVAALLLNWLSADLQAAAPQA